MAEQFVGEPIRPVTPALDTRRMAAGEPALPRVFVWRDRQCAVAEVLETWKETGPCTSGSPEQYVRKHWFRVRTTRGEEMRIYFERQARSGRQRTTRWWLYSIEPAAEG